VTATTAPTKPSDGFAIIRALLPNLPTGPGVYRFVAGDGDLLYVGKARSLRKRVASYAKPGGLNERIHRVVHLTASVEITTTASEVEALLLEANLIKKLKPRYNVVLRDDKSLPYILLASEHRFAQIAKHRGPHSRQGEYFGPFASAGAVNETLATLARAFPLRSCTDAEFARRTRPCLQYQIKRCTAPCVGRIDAEVYAAIVADARDFLSGKSHAVANRLAARMQAASAARDYETAARYRDRIRAVAHITARQDINVASLGEADVIAAHADGGLACVQVFFFRAGQNLGNRPYFPAHARAVEPGEVLAAFIGQFYADRPAPKLILISHAVPGAALLGAALGMAAGHKVAIEYPRRGAKQAVVANAVINARQAIERRLAESAAQTQLLEGVAQVLALPAAPRRIEVYDNSHIQGKAPVGAMIVAGPEGFAKSAYRKFNLANAVGDDYAMMREMLRRRFARLAEADGDSAAGERPDLVLIDGGKGHLAAVLQVMTELQVSGVAVAAISKGPDRDAGRELLHLPGRPAFSLEPRHPVLYFLQRLRDEAHRFAIGGHRAKRGRQAGQSIMDEIPGVGPGRKRALLLRFGSPRDVAAAGVADLAAVPGVSSTLAKKIYDHFHGSGRG
jgi:excinuclease ABC subunit C